MRYHRAILTVIGSVAASPSFAQSAFDGFRVGIEATYSETSLKVDAGRSKDAALSNARTQLSQGEAQMAASTAQLTERHAAFDAESRSFADRQENLRVLEREAAGSHMAASALSSLITQLQSNLAYDAASMQAASERLKAGDQALEAGRLRLAEASRLATELETYPRTSTVNLSGASARVSFGWGTSWNTQLGGIYLGGEGDAAPGVGSAVIHAPGRYDTRIEGGPSFGAAARFGWIPVPWVMPYVTSGVETQQLEVERRHRRSTRQATGFRAGFGVEFSVSESIILRVGYDHTVVPETKFGGVNVTPSRDTYRLGIVYRF